MTRSAVEQLLYLLDAAFDGEDWHSLLGNLGAVAAEEWTWTPPGGRRSIRDIVQHVGGCKLMYANHAFGDATFGWEDPLVAGGEALADPASAVAWLREAQARLRQSVAGFDDAELDRPRMTNWGEPKETRWIVATMIQHDLYHAGEINNLRSLYRGDDRWAHERESSSGG
jgi:uncharacterized damage-inducible protein DinB